MERLCDGVEDFRSTFFLFIFVLLDVVLGARMYCAPRHLFLLKEENRSKLFKSPYFCSERNCVNFVIY